MRTFCTIITSSYLPYAATLYKSLIRYHPEERLHVLVCDDGALKLDQQRYPGIHLNRLSDINGQYKADTIIHRYGNTSPDALRWSLKPVYIQYLLQQGYKKVVFSDCDIFFFNDYEQLISELDHYNVLLTPSRTTRDPFLFEDEFISGYQFGLYNAGFIGATSNGTEALRWWSNCCAYKIETDFNKGLFVDQKYLDAMPVLFENIGIVRHKGCNIAFWNQHECRRVMKKGQVLINDEFPIIFIHFTNKYIPELLSGNDPLIYPYFKEYERIFSENGSTLAEFIPGMPQYKPPTGLRKLKHKLLIRTRIKRWLYKLSQ